METFEDFWAVYPRRVAKKAARRAWEKALKDATPAEIIRGAERYRDSPSRSPRYTKHPSTWLNGGCWEDEDDFGTEGDALVSSIRHQVQSSEEAWWMLER